MIRNKRFLYIAGCINSYSLRTEVPATCPDPQPIQVDQSLSEAPVHISLHDIFYGEELFAPHPTPKLEYYPLSADCNWVFNIFATTLHIGDRSSFRNMRTRHAVVTGTDLSWLYFIL